MSEQCNYIGSGRQVFETRRCTRKAVKYGYCSRHIPSYVSPSQAKAMARHEAELNRSPREKLLAAIEEAKKEQDEARKAIEAAQTDLDYANVSRHNAELALRRFDYPMIG